MNRGGVVNVVVGARRPPAPWFVERAYPGASPWKGAALNGFMVTVLNLDATAPLLTSRPQPAHDGAAREQRAPPARAGRAPAAALAGASPAEGERTLQRYLPLHDTGKWSLYGLLTPGYTWRTHVADTGYHCYHVRLLRQLAAPGPGLRLRRAGRRKWDGYAAAPA